MPVGLSYCQGKPKYKFRNVKSIHHSVKIIIKKQTDNPNSFINIIKVLYNNSGFNEIKAMFQNTHFDEQGE